MGDTFGKNPFMDYRNCVPFMDLSGFVMKQSHVTDEVPALSLKTQLMKKKCSRMINLRRLKYRAMCEVYRNGGK